MNGKNVEKLVFIYRLSFIAIILAILIFTTIPHASSQRQSKLDSMLASINFNTVDFSPAQDVEVPVAGDIKNDDASSTSPDTNTPDQNTLDPSSLSGLVAGLGDIQSLKGDLLQKQAAAQAAQEAANQPSQSTPNYYATSHTRTNTNTVTTTNSSTNTPAPQPTTNHTTNRQTIDYNKVVFVDDNYESIDSPEYSNVPAQPDPEPTPDDSSASE